VSSAPAKREAMTEPPTSRVTKRQKTEHVPSPDALDQLDKLAVSENSMSLARLHCTAHKSQPLPSSTTS